MTPEQETRAQEIALYALGLEPAEREAYLRRRAAGEPRVLEEVRRRLRLADEIPDGFLEQPVAPALTATRSAAGEAPAEQSAAELGELPFAEGRRYRLLEVLGAGGMGVVLKAHDRRLDRQVAIKHLRSGLAADRSAVARFESEARTAARVSHPAIVEVFDVLRHGDELWIVMELVPGRSLADCLAEGPLPLGRALALAADIAAGLAAAHEVGIMHHDLKAANVMVTPQNRAKILDFGLATLVSSGDEATGGLVGTPAAMSPEQVTCCRLDARSDLFSLGTLVYEMVTGVSPFAGSSALVTLDRVRHLRPPAARRLDPGVPEELSALLEALMEKDAERRPRSAAEVCRTLAWLTDQASGAQHWQRPDEAAEAASVVFPGAGAERRRVTLLSGQLVAAGGIGSLLDPEELLEIEAPFRRLAAPILERWNGHLESWLEAGFRACFGFPRAREDDAWRAVSAALELAAAVERWRAGGGGPAGVRLRAGVHTGPTVVTTGEGGRRRIVLGRTGCCAAQMQTAGLRLPSEGGLVLVSAAARELVGDRFDCEPLGVCSLGLCSAPLEVFRVPRASASRAAPRTPFAGRQAELALLERRWREAAGGDGRVVLVSGEAGVGKTRLIEALRGRLAAASCSWLEISRHDSLRRQLAVALGREEGPGEGDPGALVRLLAAVAESRPAVLVVEDVHHADPEDQELLGQLVDRASSSRLLLVLTCRPPFEPGWRLPLHSTVCSLGPLGERDARRIVGDLAGGGADRAAVEEVLASGDGVPRFLEELARGLARGGEAVEDAGAGPAAAEKVGLPPPISVPPALASWLTARLDRLGDAREIARAASFLGREFARDRLAALVPGAGDVLDRGLDRLVDEGFLQRRGARRGGGYRFRLALDRSAAYASLLEEHRRLYRERSRMDLGA